jgi:hypothetical protein
MSEYFPDTRSNGMAWNFKQTDEQKRPVNQVVEANLLWKCRRLRACQNSSAAANHFKSNQGLGYGT